jgi:hypothetical protein
MWPFTKKKKPVPSLSSVKIKPLVSEDWLDENIIQRVQKKHSDWSRTKVMELIREYKNFLYVCARDESENVPSAEVDEIWHEHILFTKDYEDWCNFLGRKIHHNPEKVGEKKSFDEGFQKTKAKISDLSANRKETKLVKLTPSKSYKKSQSSYSPKSSSSKVSRSSPSYESPGLVDNLLLYSALNNGGNDCGESHSGHSHSHDSGGSSSSSCSSSSSSCSSSSCSSSSCGGSSCSS